MRITVLPLLIVTLSSCAPKPPYKFTCDVEVDYIVNWPIDFWEWPKLVNVFNRESNPEVYETIKQRHIEAKKNIEVSQNVQDWEALSKQEQKEYARKALRSSADIIPLQNLLEAFNGNIRPLRNSFLPLVSTEYRSAMKRMKEKYKGVITTGDPNGVRGSCGYVDLTDEVYELIFTNTKQKLLTRPSKRPLTAVLERGR